MRLKAPAKPVFLIAMILAILSLIGIFLQVPVLAQAAYWFAFFAWLVLALGNLFQ